MHALAGRFDAEVILLHVIEATYNSTLEDLDESRMEKFETFFGQSWKHLRVRKLVAHGEAAQKIVEYASQHHADLIMIPTQGMGIYRRLILGSTSAKVLHDADCPVWTGVHLENAPPLEGVACQRILCAVNLKEASARVLSWASGLAEEYQAELTLVHVAPGKSKHGHAKAYSTLERLKQSVSYPVNLRVESGDVSAVVSRLAGELKADTLVIGRKPAAGVLGRLEMIAYSIIRQSPCPVVSV